MEIVVEGTGTNYVMPDEVRMFITFNYKGQTYEDVLKQGSTNVEFFINSLLLNNGFKKDDLKTRNFVIHEEKRYDEATHRSYPDGFSFNQVASIKFDYDREKMAKMMVEISKLDNPPMCQIEFGVKDEKVCRKEVLAKAYEDALNKAEAIAMAANKKLKECVKVDFQSFSSSYTSKTRLDRGMMYAERACVGTANTIVNFFTPEDVEVCETLYCLWITE